MGTANISKRVWHKIGHTKKGEAVYKSILGHLAAERDYMYLSEMTKQEIEEMTYEGNQKTS